MESSKVFMPVESFEIPPFPPTIKRLIEPRNLKLSKLPPPGYDMKTLRKQVDSLHEEIQFTIEQQEEMYLQNHILWDYLKNLYKSNLENSDKLKKYFQSLQKELFIVYNERHKLSQKLKLAINSDTVLKLIGEEQKIARDKLFSELDLKKEAENILQK